jgi:hypothetical protein
MDVSSTLEQHWAVAYFREGWAAEVENRRRVQQALEEHGARLRVASGRRALAEAPGQE